MSRTHLLAIGSKRGGRCSGCRLAISTATGTTTVEPTRKRVTMSEHLETQWVVEVAWEGARYSGAPTSRSDADEQLAAARRKGLAATLRPQRVWVTA